MHKGTKGVLIFGVKCGRKKLIFPNMTWSSSGPSTG
jgi:hypothetical protein